MDNRMIDVAIGLALVFAMTSLMVTALQEVLSQWTSKRGQVLLRALTSFVGDDEKYVRALLKHPLIRSLSDTAPVHVTGLLASPLLKWFSFVPSDDKGPRMPSYIEADSLVSALIGQLVATHMGGVRPQTPIELISVVLSMAEHPPKLATSPGVQPNLEFARGLATLVSGVERDWPAFEARIAAWYDAVNERATGWFKRGVRVSVFFLGLATALVLNINPIEIGSRLWEDEAMRAAVVSAAQKTLESHGAARATPAPAPAPEPGPAAVPVPTARPVARPAAADARQVEQAMEALANAVFVEGERADLSAALRAGLGSVAQRVLELDRSLKTALQAQDSAQRATLLGQVAEANERLLDGPVASSVPQTVTAAQQGLRSALLPSERIAAAETKPDVPVRPPQVAAAASVRRHASCKAFEDDADVQKVCERMADLTELQRAGLPIGWTSAAWPRYGERCVKGGTPCSFGDAASHPGSWLNLLVALLGWIITAFACTLGAPFWFDALSKLVRLRSSGAPPATTKGADSSGAPPGSQLARSAKTPVAGVAPAGALAGAPGVGPSGAGDDFALKPRIAMSDALTDGERALDTDAVKRVQRALDMAEADISGWFDGATRQAIAAWQRKQAAGPATGELGVDEIAVLLMEVPPDAADEPDRHVDGCDVAITDATDDTLLPAARGGVA